MLEPRPAEPLRRRVLARGEAGWTWAVQRPGRGLVVAILLTCLLRLPFLAAPFGDDEGGYLYVAQHWSDGGHWLYGSQWVDRPPVLILVFRLVAALGATPVAMRLVAIVFACLLVGAAWYVGRRIAGAEGAVAAALVAAALGSNPGIRGEELIGDGIAACFEVLSLAVLLAALRGRDAPGRRQRRGSPLLLSAGAGMLASAAFLTKQSALIAFVVAALLLGARLRRRWPQLLAYGAGALLPLAATVVWALRGPGLSMLVNALYDFRVGAAHVVATAASRAPEERVWSFLLVMLTSGMVLPLALLAEDLRTRRGAVGLRLLVAIAAGCTAAVIVASLNWYAYYWLAVVPLAALGLAVSLVPGERRRRLRLDPRAVVAATIVMAGANVAVRLPAEHRPPAEARYVAAAARPGDTVTVVWGQPNLMEDTGLSTPYPYSWSLPVRVEDPRLRLFARTLAGPHAPTWLLEIGHLDDWGMETPRVRSLVAHRYRVAGVVCGHRIWLHVGDDRPLAAGRQAAHRGPC